MVDPALAPTVIPAPITLNIKPMDLSTDEQIIWRAIKILCTSTFQPSQNVLIWIVYYMVCWSYGGSLGRGASPRPRLPLTSGPVYQRGIAAGGVRCQFSLAGLFTVWKSIQGTMACRLGIWHHRCCSFSERSVVEYVSLKQLDAIKYLIHPTPYFFTKQTDFDSNLACCVD